MKRFALVAAWFLLALPCQAAQLYVGAASCDITPPKPVASTARWERGFPTAH